MKFKLPVPLTQEHDLRAFDCGEAALNTWLKIRALRNEILGGSRTYVLCDGICVIGYYALAVGGVEHKEVPSSLRRNMPSPIPVMVLGRLAIDKNYQGRKFGSFLLRDAILRTVQASKIAGIKAIVVHALSNEAKNIYVKHGFRSSPIDDKHLFITVSEAESCL